MATKKSQTASKTTPKATKTVTTASGKTKTVPAKKPAVKPRAASTQKSTTQKPKEAGRVIACIIGFVAAVALIIIIIVAAANCVKNRDMVVTDGVGKRHTSQYVKLMDDSFRVKVPETLKEVDPITLNVATPDSVLGAYTDKDDTISVIINVINDTSIDNDQIENYAKTLKDDVSAVNGKLLDSKTYVKDEHNIAQMRFSFGSDGTELIEDITIFAQNNQVVMTIIAYSGTNAEKWQPVSEFIANSFEFTK